MTAFTIDDSADRGAPGLGLLRFSATGYGEGSTSPRFLLPWRGEDVVQTTDQKVAAPFAGTLKNLRTSVTTAFSSGTATATVNVNGVNTTLTCTIAAAGVLASDGVHTAAITIGDDVSMQYQTSASVTSTNQPRCGVDLEEPS